MYENNIAFTLSIWMRTILHLPCQYVWEQYCIYLANMYENNIAVSLSIWMRTILHWPCQYVWEQYCIYLVNMNENNIAFTLSIWMRTILHFLPCHYEWEQYCIYLVIMNENNIAFYTLSLWMRTIMHLPCQNRTSMLVQLKHNVSCVNDQSILDSAWFIEAQSARMKLNSSNYCWWWLFWRLCVIINSK